MKRLSMLRAVLLALLVIAALVVYARAGYAFHGCENGRDCDDRDTVIVCLPQSECHFGEDTQ